MKLLIVGLSVLLAACVGVLPADKSDVYCDDYAVRINQVNYFDASGAFADGGIDSAVERAEKQLGSLLVASSVPAWTMRSEKTSLMTAARGCDVIIILEYDKEASAARRGQFFHALLARRVTD